MNPVSLLPHLVYLYYPYGTYGLYRTSVPLKEETMGRARITCEEVKNVYEVFVRCGGE